MTHRIESGVARQIEREARLQRKQERVEEMEREIERLMAEEETATPPACLVLAARITSCYFEIARVKAS